MSSRERSWRVFEEGNKTFLSESNRLVSFNTCTEYIPSIKLAKYGFGYLYGRLVECGFCARIQVIETRFYTDAEIKGLHYPKCPIITGRTLANIEFRPRGPEDSDGDRALMYLLNTRAHLNFVRGVIIGVNKLDINMVSAFLEIYPQHRLRTEIWDHFDENGLFTDADMLFERLERD